MLTPSTLQVAQRISRAESSAIGAARSLQASYSGLQRRAPVIGHGFKVPTVPSLRRLAGDEVYAASLPRFGLTHRFASATPGGTPLERYRALIDSGEINPDPNQEKVVRLLDDMCRKVSNYSPKRASVLQESSKPEASSNGGWLGGLFGGTKTQEKSKVTTRIVPKGPKGLYVYGGCGTGKTFLMDLFYETVPVTKKKRVHFNEWMIDVNERLCRLQKQNAMVQEKANTVWTAEAAMAQRQQLQAGTKGPKESADDLIAQVASEMMNEAWLLCFDEFQVTHISDAIIMKRLFSILFETGAVVIATSNRPPEDLYLHGLNRPLFLPFIPLLKSFCDVHDIASEVDYRLTTSGEEDDKRVYIYPNGKEEAKLLERKFYRICQGEVLSGAQVETQGRRIAVPKAAVNSNVGWFWFKDLCDKPLGAADYLAIASAFHTVFIADIPKLTMQERDQVRRLITMIDVFYEKHTKVVCTADIDPINLFECSEDDKKNGTFDEVFAWDRTVSRLIEMQSTKYLSENCRLIDGEQFLGQFNLTALSDDDVHEMWRRYDKDDSGGIDGSEFRWMLEDIVEKHKGHRHVSDELYLGCMADVDQDKNGIICFNEFERWLRDFSRVSSAMRL